jgi:hypothetical protein
MPLNKQEKEALQPVAAAIQSAIDDETAIITDKGRKAPGAIAGALARRDGLQANLVVVNTLLRNARGE